MPKLDPRIFRKIRVYPTFYDKQQIHTTEKFFLIHPTQKFIIRTLEPTIYSIEDVEVANSTCIPNLLDGKPATCNFTSNPMEQEVIPIDMQHILVNTINNVTLSSDCGTFGRRLSGSYLIQYETCTIQINNTSYTSKTRNVSGKPIHLPLDGITITKNGDIVNLSMEHLHKLQTDPEGFGPSTFDKQQPEVPTLVAVRRSDLPPHYNRYCYSSQHFLPQNNENQATDHTRYQGKSWQT